MHVVLYIQENMTMSINFIQNQNDYFLLGPLPNRLNPYMVSSPSSKAVSLKGRESKFNNIHPCTQQLTVYAYNYL